MEVNRFDSSAVDEGAVLDREILDCVVGAAPLDQRMTRLHAGIAEQADRVFLGAAERGTRALDAILPAAEPSLLDCDPRGLGQFLHESDKESDREADDGFAKKSRRHSAAGHRADQIEKDSADCAAGESAEHPLHDVGAGAGRESDPEADQQPSEGPSYYSRTAHNRARS